MAFTYNFGNNLIIDAPRAIIGDTECDGHIFEDSEIMMMYTIQQSQFQSLMLYSGSMGANLPSTPISYLRVAALLLDCQANFKARLPGGLTKLLDVSLSPKDISKSLRDAAAALREIDDNAGAVVLIEQCTTTFSFVDRFFRQIQRQNSVV